MSERMTPETVAEPSDTDDGELRRAVVLAVGLVVAYVVVGVLAGFVWERLWTPPDLIVRDHQAVYTGYASLRRVFTGTGLYTLVAAVASALLALAAALLARRYELIVLAAVVAGSVLAAYAMFRVGTSLGPGDPIAAAAHAANGAVIHGRLDVKGRTPYLVWPMVSLFVWALVLFAWSGRRPGFGSSRHRAEPAEAGMTEPGPG
jgi:hypothetical protein